MDVMRKGGREGKREEGREGGREEGREKKEGGRERGRGGKKGGRERTGRKKGRRAGLHVHTYMYIVLPRGLKRQGALRLIAPFSESSMPLADCGTP